MRLPSESLSASYSNTPVDAVYLWVDGDSPTGRAQRVAHGNRADVSALAESGAPNLFRDNGELRYSLRSLEAFAPWVSKVHVVTNGQLPSWIDGTHPRLNLVDHRTIFRKRHQLPTFNSHAIELNLHRIPGLSRKFLYLNDDLFVGAKLPLEAFVGNNRQQKFYFEPTPLPDGFPAASVHDRAYAYTQNIADRLWGRQRLCLLPAHTPQLYDREALERIERLIPDEFERTSGHCFRSLDDLVLRVLYASWLLEGAPMPERGEAVVLDNYSSEYHFYRHRGALVDWWRNLQAIRRVRPRFFCINDELGNSPVDRLKARSIGAGLRTLFPKPGIFERRR